MVRIAGAGLLRLAEGLRMGAWWRRWGRWTRPRTPPATPSRACDHTYRLLGSHIALRNQRRLQTAMRAARLPTVKTLADFDFSFQPSVKRDQVKSLHTLSFIERRENVVFLGPPGGDHVRVHPYFRILPRAPLPGDPSPARRLGAAAREACGRNSPKR